MSNPRTRAGLQIEAAQPLAELPFSVAALRLKEAERPTPRTGLTPEVLFVAGLLSLPAFWTSVILGELPLELMLERYVVMVFGVLMIAEPLAWMNAAGRVVPPASVKPFTPTAGHLFDEDADPPAAADPSDDGRPPEERAAVAAIFGDDDFADLDVPADLAPVTPPDFDADPFGDADGNVP